MTPRRARPSAVVDASALAALLFAEPTADEIAARLGDRELLAPALLPYEVASVCLKKIERHPSQREALREALALLPLLDVRKVDVPPDEIVAFAEGEGLTAYDAAYLWLARTLGCELVTLDGALDAAARRGRPRGR